MAKNETDLCRNRLIKYCYGQGIDLGCGISKIKVDAIGLDIYHPDADMRKDARVMDFFPDKHFDYVYSSHLLEEIENTEATLKEWLRILKEGGFLVLNQADKDLYYSLGDPACNTNHKHHFDWEALWKILEGMNTELIYHNRSKDKSEGWSFELVVRKINTKVEKHMNQYEGISILIPTLNRPQNIEDFSVSVNNTTKDPHDVEIIFGIHEEDEASKNRVLELQSKLKISIRYEIIQRYSDGKVHLSFLWNQLYEKAKYPILGYFGDDVLFKTQNWDQEVKEEFALDKYILVCCNDVHIQKGASATLYFTHKDFHNKVGYYLNPKLRRWYMDTFWDIVFRNTGKLHYRQDLITEHLHADVFSARQDATYKNMEAFKETDGVAWTSEDIRQEMKDAIALLRTLK